MSPRNPFQPTSYGARQAAARDYGRAYTPDVQGDEAVAQLTKTSSRPAVPIAMVPARQDIQIVQPAQVRTITWSAQIKAQGSPVLLVPRNEKRLWLSVFVWYLTTNGPLMSFGQPNNIGPDAATTAGATNFVGRPIGYTGYSGQTFDNPATACPVDDVWVFDNLAADPYPFSVGAFEGTLSATANKL